MSNPILPTSARASRRSAGLHAFLSLTFFASIVVAINYFNLKYYVHKDYSASQFYTLSPKTLGILKKLDAPVTAYTMVADYRPQIEALLNEYARGGGSRFKTERIDWAYQSERVHALQQKFNFDPKDSGIVLEYKGRSQFIRSAEMFDLNPRTQQVSDFKGEQKITAALLALVEGKPSKVYFTQGHGEYNFTDAESADGYGLIVENLKRENVEVLPLRLATAAEIPGDALAVVIAGPRIGLSPSESATLDRYLTKGGKAFILVNPYIQLGLDDLLKKYGMKLDDDLVLYRTPSASGEQTLPLALIAGPGFAAHPITSVFAGSTYLLQMLQARSVTLLPDAAGQPNPRVQALLTTDENGFGYISKSGSGNLSDLLSFKDIVYNKVTDVPGPVNVGVVYDGGTTTDPQTQAAVSGTRLIVFGNGLFLTNSQADKVVAPNIFVNAIDWLVKKDAVIDIAPKAPHEYGVILTPLQGRTLLWTSLVLIPGTLLLFGIVTWLSRRK